MILFWEDWAEFGAVPDWKTKNQSFIDICGVYKAMGIRNYMWPLAIYDTDLIGVDPYDPHLSRELKEKIVAECKINFSYFIREIARDPQGSPDHPILFEANRGTMALYWLYFNHVLVTLIMIRQTGKSFGDAWLDTWINNVGCEYNETSALLKDDKLRTRRLEMLKSMELTMPSYLKQRSPKDPGNTEVLRVSSLNNTYKGYVPNASPKMADLIGRGMTSANIKCDEFAYTKCNWITIPVMLSSSLAAREVARIKNAPYSTVLTTTTGKRDTPEGRYAYNFVSNSAIFSDKWFDLSGPEELYDVIKKAGDGKNVRVNATFNHRQLGKTDQWLRDRLSEAAQEDPVQIRADFLNEWPSGNTSSPFNIDLAQAMRDSEAAEIYTEIVLPEAYSIRWYYTEEERASKMIDPHILGNDPSEGVSRDSIAFVLVNAYTGETAAAIDINETNIINFYRFVGDFLLKHPSVVLNVERKSTGVGLVDYLIEFLVSKQIDPFTRIFNFVVQQKDEYKDRFNEARVGVADYTSAIRLKKYFGFSTSATGVTSRSELFGTALKAATTLGGTLMRDRKLILQTLGLTIRNGRLDHADGEHDDLVVSWLLCFWLLQNGKNLQHYGIDPSKVLTKNPKYLEQIKEVSSFDRFIQQEARNKVESLSKELSECEDEYLARRLEFDLEQAIAKLSEDDRRIVSVDDLISKLRDARRNIPRRNLLSSYRTMHQYQ